MLKFFIFTLLSVFTMSIMGLGVKVAFAQGEGISDETEMEEIDVRGIVRREELISTSATILTNQDIYDYHYITPIDILKKSPGISIRQSGDFGVANTVNIRGFWGAHHYGGRLLVTVDGIPIHDGGHADGYIDAHVINPLEIESVEIIKGPASVYYGHHAEGGVAAFQTIKFGDFTRILLRVGSQNSKDAQGVIARQFGDLGHVYSFQFYQSDGWRDHSDSEKYNISARWSYRFSENFIATLNVRGYAANWDSAGNIPSYLPKKSAVDDGSGQYAGGKRKRMDARFWANYLIGDNSEFTFYAYGVDMSNNRYSKSWAWNRAYGDRNGSDQQNRHKAFGTGLMYNYHGDLNGHDIAATLGFDYLTENERRDQWGLIWGHGRAHNPDPTYHTMDHEYTTQTLSFLGEVNYQIIEPLRARIGLRYDRFSGEVDTGKDEKGFGEPNSHYVAKPRSVFSPKVGVVYNTPLAWLELYTNYSQGFGLPYMETGDFFVNSESKVTKREQWEFGFRAYPTEWLFLESVYYILDTTNDPTVVGYDANDDPITENAGKSHRAGLESAIRIVPYQNWRIDANYTYQVAKYREHISGRNNLAGRRITSMPRHVSNIEVAYQPPLGFGGRLSFNWNADSLSSDNPPFTIDGQVNNRNTIKTQDYGSLDLQLSYKFSDRYRLFLDGLNILNKKYTSSGVMNWVTDPNHPGGYFVSGWMQPLTVYLGFEGNW
ncbi:MAG: TonB-dependent receptor [Deltaproteobacteria bacterium]|jgi:iron complex outermembrane receptor protein|nr:TonB-dependent receptor [Deltaproteobacteria bacterium]